MYPSRILYYFDQKQYRKWFRNIVLIFEEQTFIHIYIYNFCFFMSTTESKHCGIWTSEVLFYTHIYYCKCKCCQSIDVLDHGCVCRYKCIQYKAHMIFVLLWKGSYHANGIYLDMCTKDIVYKAMSY